MKLIPTGIENFKTMIDKNAYYVDKTNLIENVLNEQNVFFTRPRRFGKTLNMSMLYYFFSIKGLWKKIKDYILQSAAFVTYIPDFSLLH